jgi:hypothetical protein
MANELALNSEAPTGSTLYVVVWNEAGQAWNGTAFATYTTTRDTFDIVATEIAGTGFWQATFPGTAGYRRWAFYLQAGGTPDHDDDIKLVEGTGYWDGTNIVSQSKAGYDLVDAPNPTAVTAIQSGLATATELAKVPKSDGTVGWNATARGQINAEADTALTDAQAAYVAAIEAALVNDGDATALLQAIADKFTSEFDIEDLTLAAIASAVWNRLLVLGFAADSVGEQFQSLLQGAATSDDISELADGVNDANSTLNLVSVDVTAVKDKTDLLPASPASTGDIPLASENADAVGERALSTAPSAGTWDEAMAAARAQGGGRWDTAGNNILVYAHDGTTVLYTLVIDDLDAPTSRTPQ